jgi:hypothetical protein
MTRECFICCTKDGKSEKDRLLDEKHYVKCTNYPIIPLSHAYSCKCETTFAHNRCLQTIEKCPTCRSKTKLNLHVDLYFEKYLSWIYSKPDNIKIVENYIISYFAIIFALANLINEEFINANIYTINPKFLGKTILEEWFEYDPEMKEILERIHANNKVEDWYIKQEYHLTYDNDGNIIPVNDIEDERKTIEGDTKNIIYEPKTSSG